MNKRTLKALKESIAHWKRMRNYTKKDISKLDEEIEEPYCSDCPLCGLFINKRDDMWSECVGCPVANRAGNTGCVGTPYGAAADAWDEWVDGLSPRRTWQIFADKEIKFLESLLP